MELLQRNPFTTIKANDLDDKEINSQWVDIHENGFIDLFCPTNKMAMYLIGGKGSGKTHLMRYFSSKAQSVRNAGHELTRMKDDGYFGVYLQASGLQGSRFEQLPCSEQKRNSIFIYSFDLWLSGLFLDSILSVCPDTSLLFRDESEFFRKAIDLFDEVPSCDEISENILGLKSLIEQLSREIDININNAFVDDDLEIKIRSSRGKLVFGIPKLVAEHSDKMKDVTFLYLIDELENIGVTQQKYINTLIREKVFPVTFRVGARRHGLKTFETLGSGETNKEGHEFEIIRLDNVFSDENNYESFAIELIVNRLVAANMASKDLLSQDSTGNAHSKRKAYLESYFENYDVDKVLKNGKTKKNSIYSPLVASFKSRLTKTRAIKEPDIIVTLLSHPEDNLAEAAGIHLFCQEWSKKKMSYKELVQLAETIHEDISNYVNGITTRLNEKISHYKNNYVASAVRSKNQNNFDQYLGLDNLLRLTKGFPRHILTVLRHIYKLEVFSGRAPFLSDGPISIKSQKLALKESADWFHDDCITEGHLGNNVAIALQRLCEILRLEYYADKPVECSASSFTIQRSLLPPELMAVIEWAELIRVIVPADQPRQDKNSQELKEKYHINGLLCPRWGLPINRRGSLDFDLETASTIFDSNKVEAFAKYKTSFEQSRYAPFDVFERGIQESIQPGLDL